ncbi:MAG: S-adenosylmethionine decarboxylase proenzyme [Deltaproteobacteria bacterium]|nr:S-adenosylmethionine decarboxylase proenzyme [Deltaproteobacteria bacterium]MBW2068126.1 S-adenosylmethionine decarboxylase proenzyme [Deltaproteobacteria bacterium]
MKSLGKHLIAELYDCDRNLIASVEKIEKLLIDAVNISKATIIKPVFHQFNPHGVSGVVVIAESHFSIHTWPEYGYCALDIFTCGEQIDADAALRFLKEALKAGSMSIVEMKRGTLDVPEGELKHKP